jgi:dTDP-4-amino-4,6-dideoxygalactose transaminase
MILNGFNMIPVTKSYLPPIEDYQTQLARIWKNEWLTNRGELVQELEQKISSYLDLKDTKLIAMNNGTIPLQIALKLLANGGEVITTPFSYVATTAAIVWENCTPVFVDIHKEYLTIDETKIEGAITSRTTCILATHVFGNPCNIEVIESIALKYNLKVIYDAAHCFGVNYKGKSIFEYGDVSTCSFHATKLFHTGEGGVIFCKDTQLFHKIFYSHNFGHNGPLDFHGLGINGKMSELHAAMGLSVLPHLDEIINKRKEITKWYDQNINFSFVEKIKIRSNTQWNHSYYPILFKNEKSLLQAQSKLIEHDILPRRYFYPSLNQLPYIIQKINPIADNIAESILCLPIYTTLQAKELKKITTIINQSIHK